MVWELCWRFFGSVFRFCSIKGCCSWKCKFLRPCLRNPASRWLQIGHKQKRDRDVTMCRHDVIVNCFWRCYVSLVKFSYWSKFHVNVLGGSGVITIFVYKELTRKPKIRNIFVWVLPNLWRPEQARDTKYGTNVFNKMLMNAGKF